MGDGYVYVVGADELGNRVKIGWSDNPERRLGELQVGAPYVLRLLDKHFGSSRKLEDFLHDEFALLRIHGEWFDFGTRDPLPLIAEAAHGWVGEVEKDPRADYVFDEPGLTSLPKRPGLTSSEQILALHIHVPSKPGGALRWTRAKMAAYVGISVRTVATAIEHLIGEGRLTEAERHGRLIYYQASQESLRSSRDHH